ncbi:hypothetical protein K438DRAFT_1991883 [Mycena galopus ATCC 62051]|nr:hypothetical protein K438DRAFT_1991883 [Mycena galopus ATCC 62051]
MKLSSFFVISPAFVATFAASGISAGKRDAGWNISSLVSQIKVLSPTACEPVVILGPLDILCPIPCYEDTVGIVLFETIGGCISNTYDAFTHHWNFINSTLTRK